MPSPIDLWYLMPWIFAKLDGHTSKALIAFVVPEGYRPMSIQWFSVMIGYNGGFYPGEISLEKSGAFNVYKFDAFGTATYVNDTANLIYGAFMYTNL